jgi:hypothetical protein
LFYSFCSPLFAGNIYRGGATTFLKYQEEVVYTDSFFELPQGLTKAKPTKSSKKRKRIVEGGTKKPSAKSAKSAATSSSSVVVVDSTQSSINSRPKRKRMPAKNNDSILGLSCAEYSALYAQANLKKNTRGHYTYKGDPVYTAFYRGE